LRETREGLAEATERGAVNIHWKRKRSKKLYVPQALRPEKAFGYFWPAKVTS
jgi:hypothetical protein